MNIQRISISLLAGLLMIAASAGQDQKASLDSAPKPVKKPAEVKFKHDTFTFVRVQWDGTRSRSAWATDYPDSDINLTARVAADTDLKTDPNGKVLRLSDPELKKYPFIYLCEPGTLLLSDEEVRLLREYLTGGGFLMVDDFWGEAEWANFQEQFRRVFPDRPLKDLPLDHPLFHCFYDITSLPQVPSIFTFRAGRTTEREDAGKPQFKGLTDDTGRLLALVCHNTDLGDGWEQTNIEPRYFREVSQQKAYPMGVNVVVFALSQ